MNYRLLITAIAFSILAPHGAASYAAEVDNAEPPLESSEETASSTAAEDEAEDEAEDKTLPAATSPDVFIPTEDISEDFAVSFPVDI